MLKFLYQTMPGRCILKLLTRPGLSRFVGRFMDSAISRPIIPRFIRKNNIDMNDYLDEEYGCFNDFFFRHFKFIVSVQWRSADKSMYVVQSGIKNSINIFLHTAS